MAFDTRGQAGSGGWDSVVAIATLRCLYSRSTVNQSVTGLGLSRADTNTSTEMKLDNYPCNWLSSSLRGVYQS
jgi:hypothetical protein